MPACHTSKMTQLEMQENMTSFADRVVKVESGGGDSEIAPVYLISQHLRSIDNYQITSWYWRVILPGDSHTSSVKKSNAFFFFS